MEYCDIHLRQIPQELLEISIRKIGLEYMKK